MATIFGKSGDDTLNGTSAHDSIWGFAGADYLNGQGGDDDLMGGLGDDVLWGDLGEDTLNGGHDNDQLFGSYHDDILNGGDGDDWLSGGHGQDTLIGGIGADTFVVNTIHFVGTPDSTVADPDYITDFSHAQGDRIDVSLLDANGWFAGNQSFTFIGTAAFTGVAGQLRYEIIDLKPGYTDYTRVTGDMNGDGAADFQINAAGQIAFVAADFVL
jgi:Ca2+-binding RTX toxin-like protein